MKPSQKLDKSFIKSYMFTCFLKEHVDFLITLCILSKYDCFKTRDIIILKKQIGKYIEKVQKMYRKVKMFL